MQKPKQLSLPFEPEHWHAERPEILVIGDYLKDLWYDCDNIAISAEAPVPVVKAKKCPLIACGGAGNVCTNLREMGWKVWEVFQPLTTGNIPTKKRYMYQGRQIFRVDEYDKIYDPIDPYRLNEYLAVAKAKGLPVVVADYNKGAIDAKCLRLIGARLLDSKLNFYIHTKRCPTVYTNRVSPLFFYNQKEYDSLNVHWAYRVIVTRGAQGATQSENNLSVCAPIPGTMRSTCGAGDVFMAAYVTAKELWGLKNPLAIADAVAKRTVCESKHTCVYSGEEF